MLVAAPPAIYSFTINTDASRDPKTGKAAWAYWIRSTNFLFRDSSLYPDSTPNSSIAELFALKAALECVNASVGTMPREMVRLYINTDSQWVLQALRGNVKRSKHLSLAEAVKDLAEGYELVLRHVKAHKHKDTPRHWVNDWCDKEAKRLLRTYLREVADGRQT
jgi:ribonuclease HI